MNNYASTSSANNPLMPICGLISDETPTSSSVASNEFASTIIRLDIKEKYLHEAYII